jgi:predicted negative regulator of RcsB-dependent stress response
MKSEHRHELETNALAKKLKVAVERFRPYASTIAGVIVAVVVLMFLWSYFARSSTARQSEAWDAYNQAIIEAVPDVEQLRQTAQEHPGTKMQQMADVTWADSQVWIAARDYIYNRPAATEAITKALSAYLSVIQSSDDERLVNRARLGVARAYEIQGKLDEAAKTYGEVKGAFEEYAKRQAERLAKPETKDTYAWLATARPKLPQAPTGPGTPGVQPEFSASDLALPGASPPAASPDAAPATSQSIEDLLKGLEVDFTSPTGDDRYAPGGTTPPPTGTQNETTPNTTSAAPATTETTPPSTPPPADNASTEGSAPAESATSPAEPEAPQ